MLEHLRNPLAPKQAQSWPEQAEENWFYPTEANEASQRHTGTSRPPCPTVPLRLGDASTSSAIKPLLPPSGPVAPLPVPVPALPPERIAKAKGTVLGPNGGIRARLLVTGLSVPKGIETIPGLNPVDLLVYARMVACAENPPDVFWGTHSGLAEKLGIDDKTARAAVGRLVRARLVEEILGDELARIRREHRQRIGTWHSSRKMYRFLIVSDEWMTFRPFQDDARRK